MPTTLRCKVVLLGACKAGKTSLAQVFHGKQFPKVYNMTQGVSFFVSPVTIPNSDMIVELFIYDTSGHQVYNEQRAASFESADAIIAVYDITSADSLKQACMQANEALRAASTSRDVATIKGVLVGNKTDLVDVQEVKTEEGDKAAADLQFTHVRVGALDNDKVDVPFTKIAHAFAESFANAIASVAQCT